MTTINVDDVTALAGGTRPKAKKGKKARSIPTTATETTSKKTKATTNDADKISIKDKLAQTTVRMFLWIRKRPRLFKRWIQNNGDLLTAVFVQGLYIFTLLSQIIAAGFIGWFLAGLLLGLNGVIPFALALGVYLLSVFGWNWCLTKMYS